MIKDMRNLLCICLALLILSCNSGDTKTVSKTKTVKLARVEKLNEVSKREFSFISKPFKEVSLAFRVSGQIDKLDVQAGDYFKKGEVIASLDSRDFRIKRYKALAKYEQAKAEFNRIESLYNKKNISASFYDKAKVDMFFAKAAYETAFNAYEDTKLKAPFNGYIQTVYKDCFQDVRTSEPVVYFINLDKIKLEAFIPEEVAIKSHSIKNISIKFDAYPSNFFNASILNVSKSTTENNLSFLLTASMNNKDTKFNLLGGMNGNISFITTEKKSINKLLIPQIAVCNSPSKGSYVWLFNKRSKKVKSVPVKLGALYNNDRIEIISNLNIGDSIVVTGHSFLSNNDIVSI